MDNASIGYAVGIDIGGTNIKTVAVSTDGSVLARRSLPTGSSREEWARNLTDCLAGVADQLHESARGIAVAAPGLPARDGRSIAWMRGRLENLQGLNWTQVLQSAAPVQVINDAQAAVLGEAWTGAAAGRQNVVMLTLGTGVGGGALVDGHVLRGHLGRAGHLGHITVNAEGPLDIVGTPGSLEDAIGDCTVTARSNGRFATTRDLVAACQEGDKDAVKVWRTSINRFAAGVTSLINVLDPEVIVIGGGIAAAGPMLFEPLEAELNRIEWRPTDDAVKVFPAELGEWSGAVGAAKLAWQSKA